MINRKCGIRTHVVWLTLLPMLIMVLAMEAFFLHDRYSGLDHDLIENGRLIARQVAASSEYGVFSNNRVFLNGIVEGALQQPDVKGGVVLNASHEIVASAGFVSEALTTYVRTGLGQSPESLNREAVVFDDGRTVLLYQPILPSQVDLSEFESSLAVRQVGAVVLEMSWEQTRKIKFQLLWFSMLATIAFLLVTLYLMHLASRSIIQPISKLSEAIHAIGAGNLETRVTMPSSIRELCVLTRGINQMTADLQNERAILQHRIHEATVQLRNLAFYDTLTLLPNRRLLNDRLIQALAASARSGEYGALMFLDLDNFKTLNDQSGHAVGDRLLVEAANRISGCLRETDTVARFGGDEFVVMLGSLDGDQESSRLQAQRVAEKIRMVLAETYHLVCQTTEGSEIKLEHHCTSSIGVVLFLGHEASQDELLSWADTAMYTAKKGGRNRICFYRHAASVLPASGDLQESIS